ncbi:hypothetical protein CONLIGDRAFT_641025 [Coniochaeta ligniaria NRRL 30616]|uniref:Uncharacterized protein n=1 Tax=Coniochaeta ligniaria NRRL 30616 TaxID=1408157 RepID=A0A1J7J3M0_9PEZI|nr:hypothetical protein CONLIGDRAFT_641025 [Coniochaeta ligniaria NRRL 30616]
MIPAFLPASPGPSDPRSWPPVPESPPPRSPPKLRRYPAWPGLVGDPNRPSCQPRMGGSDCTDRPKSQPPVFISASVSLWTSPHSLLKTFHRTCGQNLPFWPPGESAFPAPDTMPPGPPKMVTDWYQPDGAGALREVPCYSCACDVQRCYGSGSVPADGSCISCKKSGLICQELPERARDIARDLFGLKYPELFSPPRPAPSHITSRIEYSIHLRKLLTECLQEDQERRQAGDEGQVSRVHEADTKPLKRKHSGDHQRAENQKRAHLGEVDSMSLPSVMEEERTDKDNSRSALASVPSPHLAAAPVTSPKPQDSHVQAPEPVVVPDSPPADDTKALFVRVKELLTEARERFREGEDRLEEAVDLWFR